MTNFNTKKEIIIKLDFMMKACEMNREEYDKNKIR